MTDADLVIVPPDAAAAFLTLPPITAQEAKVFAWHKGFLLRYELAETLWCVNCFKANRGDGCSSEVTPNSVRIRCRCGVREYRAPKGTDLPTSTANSPMAITDTSPSTLTMPDGKTLNVPGFRMDPEEALGLREYQRVVKNLDLTPRIFHRECWNRRVTEGNEMITVVNPTEIFFACNCRVLFFKGAGSH